MSTKNLSIEERRRRLERRAEVIRSRLLRTVDALDVRRHQVADVGRRAKDAAPAAIGVVAGAAVLLGGSVALIGWGLRRRKKALLGYRIAKALEPFRVERKPSFAAELGKKMISTLVTILLTEVARRSAKNAFDGRLPSGAHANGVATHETSLVGG